ncbi:hypothetical protein DFJ74DRAFT_683448 [Hyaloraphidium curvatum]|nr:hypothetical protein DFJ74DRAFT_683448 [Hyaloraphidium curvatum]
MASPSARAEVPVAREPKPAAPQGPGAFHRVAMWFLMPTLFLWDQLVFLVDFAFATLLWLLGSQVSFAVDYPTATNHPIVVCTGTSTGIGFHTAIALAGAGYHVFAGVRRPADGEKLLDAWRARRSALKARRGNVFFRVLDFVTGWLGTPYVPGGDLKWIIVDVAKVETIGDAVRQVETELRKQQRPGGKNGVYAVFANAGINLGSVFELETLQEEKKIMDVNFFGALETCRAFLPLIRRNGSGRIVITGSLLSMITAPMNAAYCASKHAIRAAGDAMRMELAPLGIAVSNMEPGEIETEIWNKQYEMIDQMVGHPNRKLYEGHIRTFAASLKLSAAFPGTPPWYCAISLLHALRSPFPMPRYPVGLDSWGLRFVRCLTPDRIYDAVVVNSLRMGSQLPEATASGQ